MLWKISGIFDSVQYTKKFQMQPKISFPQMVNLFGITYIHIYIYMNNYEYTYVCVFLFNFNMQLPIQIHFVTTARWEPPCKDQEAFPSDNSVFS